MQSSHLQAFVDQFSAAEPVLVDPSRVLAALAELPDPRARRGIRYQFAHLVLIMVCSVLAGAKTLVEMAEWAADTARTELAACGIGAPHATTLARVFERLDSDAFDLLAADWAQGLGRPVAIAVDGKEMRGAKNGTGSRVHLLAAIDQDTHAVLAQVAVGEKSNEIPQFPVLMDHFRSLTDVVVTADALHTQAGHAHYLAGRGAHYIFTVKGNQPTLLKQLSETPWERVPTGDRSGATANGRQIVRTVKCATLSPGIKFPHALQAMQITRKSRPVGTRKWHLETVYAVTSLPTYQASPGQLAGWVRGHWGIENGLHWRRDVLFHEDKHQARNGETPRVLAILRNIAITLLKCLGHKNLARTTRHLRNHPGKILEMIGFSSR